MSEQIEKLTREHFSLGEKKSLKLEPILKGGSGRSFYRFQLLQKSFIVMHFTEERPENSLYYDIGLFLKNLTIPVPTIEGYDVKNRILWMEDLGKRDLCSLSSNNWEIRKFFYYKTLDAIKCLHEKGWEEASRHHLKLMPGFDEKLYLWERHYFIENFVERVCGYFLTENERNYFEKLGDMLAQSLLQEKVCLIHRDFQSQNILLRDDSIYLIDFQGMRAGTLFYDLASLLYDPYVSFQEEERLDLLRYYYELQPQTNQSWTIFHQKFQYAAIQRLMQALGAYGFLGLVKGKGEFLNYIKPAFTQLQRIIEDQASFSTISALLKKFSLPSLSKELV